MTELRILSPTAILGYGFPVSSFEAGLRRNPHVIAVDAGSTDPGPYYLGAGVCFTERRAVKRDLQLILQAALPRRSRVIIGSAGGSGANCHLERDLGILRELAAELQLHFTVAVIQAEIAKESLLALWREGKITPLAPAPDLTEADIVESTRVVGQMGMDPILRALDSNADVILAGRCYDPAVFAALPVREGFDPGLAIHLGKILECAAIAATPGSGSDCLFGTIYPDHFTVEPLNSNRRCTTLSVAAHTLYEKSNPYLLPGPGGMLDLRQTQFEQVTAAQVRVSGSRFSQSEPYRIKLEGARRLGFRTIAIAGVRDPIMIRQIDPIIAAVKERVADNFQHESWSYHLNFTVYGKNGVMGLWEPQPFPEGHELGIVIEAVGTTQEIANTICGFARSTMLHYGYAGRIATAGNLAFPYSPSDFKAGEVYAFSLYHLVETDDPCRFFPMQRIEL